MNKPEIRAVMAVYPKLSEPCPCSEDSLIESRCRECRMAVRKAPRVDGALDSSIHSSECQCHGDRLFPTQSLEMFFEAAKESGNKKLRDAICAYIKGWIGSDYSKEEAMQMFWEAFHETLTEEQKVKGA